MGLNVEDLIEAFQGKFEILSCRQNAGKNLEMSEGII